MDSYIVKGNIVDVVNQRVFKGSITIAGGKVALVKEEPVDEEHYVMPGFVDAHVHVESSMLIPSEFARLAVVQGTVATISDPHEIANVLGVEGVEYMIGNGKKVPFKFYFGAPSCVPATIFETAGASVTPADIEQLMQRDEIKYLAEMMNFPGVLHADAEVMEKLAITKKYGKVIDGHAPGLRGEDAKKYIDAGISTDHECFTREEALDKLQYGMKIQIREGSAAKNFEALIDLLNDYPDKMMFCSDDKHPNDLAVGHVNLLARRAVAKGIDVMKVLRACTYNIVQHYSMEVGLLQEGDPADFIVVDDLKNFNVQSTFIDGQKVAENGKTLIESVHENIINNFQCDEISVKDIEVPTLSKNINVIEALDGQLITKCLQIEMPSANGLISSDTSLDVLKMVVVNRYHTAKPAVAFVKNFGLKKGALASTVAHDSHNIVAVGVDDADIVQAINLLISHKGGVSLAWGDEEGVLPLPVAGLMSNEDGYKVAEEYEALDKKTKEWGATLHSPYMTMSFLALLVIPELKLSDKGLFDGKKFEFTSLYNGVSA